jgi:hypothetical protein
MEIMCNHRPPLIVFHILVLSLRPNYTHMASWTTRACCKLHSTLAHTNAFHAQILGIQVHQEYLTPKTMGSTKRF